MNSPEALSPTPSVIPFGRVAPLRSLTEFMTPLEPSVLSRTQAIIHEEINLMRGTDEKPGENPEAWNFINLISAHFNNGGPIIHALRSGLICGYHTARYRGDAVGTQVPTISSKQLESYFSEKGIYIEDGKLIQYGPGFPWDKRLVDFMQSEEQFMTTARQRGLGQTNDHASFLMGNALMWDFLKTAPELPAA